MVCCCFRRCFQFLGRECPLAARTREEGLASCTVEACRPVQVSCRLPGSHSGLRGCRQGGAFPHSSGGQKSNIKTSAPREGSRAGSPVSFLIPGAGSNAWCVISTLSSHGRFLCVSVSSYKDTGH